MLGHGARAIGMEKDRGAKKDGTNFLLFVPGGQ
jgi:hypothetical protein